ncbi:MAG: extracellular solute-binding protein, partial [Hyphomicrobiaceae bacterium]
MASKKLSRRQTLIGVTAATASGWATRVISAAPPATAITPALIEAARKEAKLNFYTAMDIAVAEKLAKGFEAKFPGIAVRVERSGSERLFQRIGQEMGSNIRNVDLVNTADAAHVIAWKRKGWLAPFLPEDVARAWQPHYRDADGTWATVRIFLSVIAYNSKLVAPADAPRSFADLLDPKWSGKLVKGHPGYSGTIMTATHQMARDLGWSYFEKLAGQKVMQVQSSTDPPKKISLGERAVQVDGGDYNVFIHKQAGAPVEIVYAAEGSPTISGPNTIFAAAVNPNAARLFQCWMCSREGQQFFVGISGQYPAHGEVKGHSARKQLADIKLMREDPVEVEAKADEIKSKYT